MIIATGIEGVLLFLYSCFVVSIGIYLLLLVSRFVKSQERMTAALERFARNSQPDQ